MWRQTEQRVPRLLIQPESSMMLTSLYSIYLPHIKSTCESKFLLEFSDASLLQMRQERQRSCGSGSRALVASKLNDLHSFLSELALMTLTKGISSHFGQTAGT